MMSRGEPQREVGVRGPDGHLVESEIWQDELTGVFRVQIIAFTKEEMKKANLSEQTMIGIIWTSVMSCVEWNKKEELVTEQAIKHLKVPEPHISVGARLLLCLSRCLAGVSVPVGTVVVPHFLSLPPQQYSLLLKAFTSQGLSELSLLLKIQEYCYDNIHFMKAFQKIVVLLYKGGRPSPPISLLIAVHRMTLFSSRQRMC